MWNFEKRINKRIDNLSKKYPNCKFIEVNIELK